MTYDLRREPWIPWRRRHGAIEWGPPAMLVDDVGGDDPVVALAAPRPDFDGALQEFLIGLLSAALQPADEREWKAMWSAPPSVEQLQTALDALPPAFDLEGDGPQFFQDLSASDFAGTDVAPIDQLLIDTPGDQGVRLNKDLFVKRGRAGVMGRPAAAMALITMQTYAPAGGQGHRTSLRGGGPLTTLVDPRAAEDDESREADQPLWRKLWANVETREQWVRRALPDSPLEIESAFPWLAPTRTSNPEAGGRVTTPADAHPLQAYFGLPRRIRLEVGGPGTCDLTGQHDERTVTGFRMVNYGVQYVAWRHPLSPYYQSKSSDEWLPRHGQPGGIGWRDWITLALEAPGGAGDKPAAVVADFNRTRGLRSGVSTPRLHAFGYDMNKMKARGWVDANLPMFAVEDVQRQQLLYASASALTNATGIAATALHAAVKDTLFQSAKDASGDTSHLRAEPWAATESAFYDAMRALAATGDIHDAADEARRRREAFALVLLDRALDVFDHWCPAAGLAVEVLRRRVKARYDLRMALRGYSTRGEKLFTALEIPLPGGGRTARAAKKRSRTTAKENAE